MLELLLSLIGGISAVMLSSAVKNLKVGEVIDMEGFLYWYNGVNPHITSVKVVG